MTTFVFDMQRRVLNAIATDQDNAIAIHLKTNGRSIAYEERAILTMLVTMQIDNWSQIDRYGVVPVHTRQMLL